MKKLVLLIILSLISVFTAFSMSLPWSQIDDYSQISAVDGYILNIVVWPRGNKYEITIDSKNAVAHMWPGAYPIGSETYKALRFYIKGENLTDMLTLVMAAKIHNKKVRMRLGKEGIVNDRNVASYIALL